MSNKEGKADEILAGNEVISVFMGLSIGSIHYAPYGGSSVISKHLKYHSSWDWIMSVVEKIEAIHLVYEHTYINVRISNGYIEIEGTGTRISVLLKDQRLKHFG